MAATATNVNSAVGTTANVAPQETGEEEPVEVINVKRTYEHYVSNNMDAYGYTQLVTTAPAVDVWMLDEGWHLIPYWNVAVAMTQADLNHIGARAQAVRIDKLGYTIKAAQIMRQQITTIAGTATISNTFVPQPYFELFTDDMHRFDNCVYPRPATSTTWPISSAVIVTGKQTYC